MVPDDATGGEGRHHRDRPGLAAGSGPAGAGVLGHGRRAGQHPGGRAGHRTDRPPGDSRSSRRPGCSCRPGCTCRWPGRSCCRPGGRTGAGARHRCGGWPGPGRGHRPRPESSGSGTVASQRALASTGQASPACRRHRPGGTGSSAGARTGPGTCSRARTAAGPVGSSRGRACSRARTAAGRAGSPRDSTCPRTCAATGYPRDAPAAGPPLRRRWWSYPRSGPRPQARPAHGRRPWSAH